MSCGFVVVEVRGWLHGRATWVPASGDGGMRGAGSPSPIHPRVSRVPQLGHFLPRNDSQYLEVADVLVPNTIWSEGAFSEEKDDWDDVF